MNNKSEFSGMPKINSMDKGKKSGFFDLPKVKKECQDPNHKPPTHLHIPEHKGYRHVCPSCGNVIDLYPSQISL